MPQTVIKKTPKEFTYPRIEEEKSSSKPYFGSKNFADSYDFLQVLQSLCLFAIDEYALIAGILVGASKPVYDLTVKKVIPKEGMYEHNQNDFGEIIMKDREYDLKLNEKVQEYIKKNNGAKPKIPYRISNFQTFTTLSGMMVVSAFVLKHFFSPLASRALVAYLGINSGFSLAQRAVQYWGLVFTKK